MVGVISSGTAYGQYDGEYVNLTFSTQNPIDDAILFPQLGDEGNWFGPAQYGPYPAGFSTAIYENPDYYAYNFEMMGVDTEADGSLGFFVAVNSSQIHDVAGKTFSQVFPGYDESDVISAFEQGIDDYGYFANSTESYLMGGYEHTYNLGSDTGLFYLYSFSSGTEIGTVNFAYPNSGSTPGPLAALPFGIGLAARLRRRGRKS
jgi:hypothetical protein